MAQRRKKHRGRARSQKSVRAIMKEAVKCLGRKDVKAAHKLSSEAIRRARQGAERDSSQQLFVESSFRLALETREPQEKFTLVEEALRFAPDEPRLHFQRGILLLQDDQPHEALEAFETVAGSEPDREGLPFFLQLASLAAKGKKGRKTAGLSEEEKNTLALLERVQQKPSKKLAEAPLPERVVGSQPALWELLLKMRHERRFVPTEEDFQKLTGTLPSEGVFASILRYYHGVAAMRDSQEDTAFGHWHSALTQGFGPRWCQKNIALSYRQNLLELTEKNRWLDIVNTIHHFPKNLEDDTLNQLHSLALFHLGYEQAEKNRWPQASKYWQEAAEKANNRYLAQNLALALEKQGEWELAADAWKDMLRRKPRKTDHPDYLNEKQVAKVWEHISECYYEDYCDEDALDCLRKAVEYDPQNLERRFKLVSAFGAEGFGNQDAAMRELQAILKLDPDNLNALTQLAHYYKKNRWHARFDLWKRILKLEPDNKEARDELAQGYVEQAYPPQRTPWFTPKPPAYKQQLAILKEGLELMPNHPELLLALGWAHIDARKKKPGKEALLQAYQAAPKNLDIASSVLQNLIHLQEAASIEELISEIQQNPILLPMFWIDQAKGALGHPGWPERFFEAAIQQVAYSDKRAGVSKASTLVDIYMALLKEEDYRELQKRYLAQIEQEVPQSGALEYLQAFMSFEKTGDKGKARRLLRKAKKLASAANETRLLGYIQDEENFLSGRRKGPLDSIFGPGMPPLPKDMQGMMEEVEDMMAEIERTQGPQALEQLMKRMMEDFEAFGGMDDGEFF